MAIIEVAGVTKEYPRGITSLKDVSVTIEAGEFVYVLGASGSGKSSFIKLLYRDIKPTKGTVTVCGHNVGKLKNHAIHHLRREIGIVFQDCKLLTGKTVFENIAFALEVMGEDTEAISEKVHRSLETVGLADKADSYPDQLSGGEKQRISIARAILKDAPIIILDEATSSVDPENENLLMGAISELTKNKTVIMIAHRLKTVRNADQIFVLSGGHIVQTGKHEDLIRQPGIYADFIGIRKKAIGWKLR